MLDHPPDLLDFGPKSKNLKQICFELFECMHENSTERTFRKLLPELFPGMAEMMEYVYKVREEYFEGDHIQYIC